MSVDDKVDDVRSLVCLKCGEWDRIAELDVVPGYALIQGINPDGSIEWSGESDVDWNGQKPANDPPQFICLSCETRFGHEILENGDLK